MMTQRKTRRKIRRSKIPIKEHLKLWVKAGASCEFRGCSEYLYKDGLTLREANYADVAHIVAASKNGPRGDFPLPLSDRNKCDNLFLACKKHHKLIDSKEHENEYPVELLRQFKNEHEERVRRVIGMLPEHKTAIVRLRSRIGQNTVSIGNGDIYQAISPRFPTDDKGLDIDLTHIVGTDSKSYWQTGAETISKNVEEFLAYGVNQSPPPHLSIFAFGPIPFLMKLGHSLGSKIPYDIFQKHRDTDTWNWRPSGKIADYSLICVSKGKSNSKVGILLSLSVTIIQNDLSQKIKAEFPLYQLTLVSRTPSPMFMRRREDLARFKSKYLSMLDHIRRRHPEIKELHIFPAVPVSIAVLCGIERLPKVHPKFIVYDYNQNDRGFKRTLTLR